MMEISFQVSGETRFTIRNKKQLREWIVRVIVGEKCRPGEITFVFTTDEELLKFNRQYLSHDYYTDIITFDYSQEGVISGDVLISVDRVRDNADKFGVDFKEELCRVMAHGVLHLCGYRDKKKSESARMRKKENEALKLLAQ
jgi:probable rRNA maturation factor